MPTGITIQKISLLNAANFQLEVSRYQILKKKKLPEEYLSGLEFHLHVSEQQNSHS